MAANTPETIYTATKRVSCDGGEGALGHPRVWLEMGESPRVECPYCSQLYILKNDKAHTTQSRGEKSAFSTPSPDA